MQTLFRPADTGHILFIHDHIEQDACDVPFGRAASRLQLFHALMQVQGWHWRIPAVTMRCAPCRSNYSDNISTSLAAAR